MRTTIFTVAVHALAAVLVTAPLAAGAARAADYGARLLSLRPLPPRSRVVAVDELFLRAGGCPRNPNCIAPRILPTEGYAARGESFVGITVPAPLRPVAPFSFFGFD